MNIRRMIETLSPKDRLGVLAGTVVGASISKVLLAKAFPVSDWFVLIFVPVWMVFLTALGIALNSKAARKDTTPSGPEPGSPGRADK